MTTISYAEALAALRRSALGARSRWSLALFTCGSVVVGLLTVDGWRNEQMGVGWWLRLVCVLLLAVAVWREVRDWLRRRRLAAAPDGLHTMTVAPEVHTTHHRLVGASGDVWDLPWSGVHATTGQQVWVTPLEAGRPCYLVVPGAETRVAYVAKGATRVPAEAR